MLFLPLVNDKKLIHQHPQAPSLGLSHLSDSSSYLPDTLEGNLKKTGLSRLGLTESTEVNIYV